MTQSKANDDMYTIELEVPMDVAEELRAKAGSIDAAVVHALQEYLKVDHTARNADIREFAAQGRSIERLARFHGMSTQALQAIVDDKP